MSGSETLSMTQTGVPAVSGAWMAVRASTGLAPSMDTRITSPMIAACVSVSTPPVTSVPFEPIVPFHDLPI